MIARLYYTGQMAWRYRKQLAHYARGKALHTNTLLDLDPHRLAQDGIQGLILDFDGVLAPHAASKPLAVVEDWLQKAMTVFKPDQFFILSNRPTTARMAYFKSHFPDMMFVYAKRKKPFIDGIQTIVHDRNVAPQQLLLIDDRLLTGLLAAQIAGIQGCYVYYPWIDWKQRPFSESWYWVLRRIERWLLAFF